MVLGFGFLDYIFEELCGVIFCECNFRCEFSVF